MTTIRKIIASEQRENILMHYLLLDSNSLYQRFHSQFNEYAIKKYVDSIKDDDICIGIYLDDVPLREKSATIAIQHNINQNFNSNVLIGFLHLSFAEENAEIGLSIVKKYQGFGLSNVLMSMAISELYLEINAKDLKIKEVIMYCDASNKASIALGKKFGLKVVVENNSSCMVIEQIKKFDKLKEKVKIN